jgi:hypothetical protein
MTFEKKFTKKLNARFSKKQNELHRDAGVMGDPNGNLTVDGLDNYVYVTVAGRSFPAYFNPSRITPKAGVKVWVGYSPEEQNLYQILSTRSSIPDQSGATQAGSAKRTFFDIRSITFLRIGMSASGGMNVDLYQGRIWSGTEHIPVARQDIDISSHVPVTSDKAAFVLITINTAGSVVQTKGGEVDITALAHADIPAPPDGTAFVCGAVRVYYGQTTPIEAETNTDFVDLRMVDYGLNTGGSGGVYFAPSGLTGAQEPSRYVGATTSGAPSTGTFEVGDFVIDLSGTIWICTTAGGPGTWTSLGGSSGGRTLISEQTPSGVSSVSWTSIPSTYKKLTLELVIRSTQAANNVDGYIRFNNDTTDANYRRQLLRHNNFGSTNDTGADARFALGTISAANAIANGFANAKIDIIQYANTAFTKRALVSLGMVDNAFYQSLSGMVHWSNTAAINRIDIVLGAGNFVTGSVLLLYGDN